MKRRKFLSWLGFGTASPLLKYLPEVKAAPIAAIQPIVTRHSDVGFFSTVVEQIVRNAPLPPGVRVFEESGHALFPVYGASGGPAVGYCSYLVAEVTEGGARKTAYVDLTETVAFARSEVSLEALESLVYNLLWHAAGVIAPFDRRLYGLPYHSYPDGTTGTWLGISRKAL